MKLRFLVSHCTKYSVRDKMIGRNCIYSERNMLHRQSVGHSREQVWQSQNMVMIPFYGMGNFLG